MRCPNCGYDGDGWASDCVLRSDGLQGYICPKCNYHFIVGPGMQSAKFEYWLRQIVRDEFEQALKNMRNRTRIRGGAL